MGGATKKGQAYEKNTKISIHAPRGGSDLRYHTGHAINADISIHAPRGGSDPAIYSMKTGSFYFNPRSPWGERPVPCAAGVGCIQFQSTLPVGGATCVPMNRTLPYSNISIHAPRGGSDTDFYNPKFAHLGISIHAPRGGSDSPGSDGCPGNGNGFQSTLPVGGATLEIPAKNSIGFISIHAPRGGSDRSESSEFLRIVYFNPRSPWGERLVALKTQIILFLFQSTLPVGGATVLEDGYYEVQQNFNPRSPWGERPCQHEHIILAQQFQSTLPVGGATIFAQLVDIILVISIHAPRGGSDLP